MDWDWDCDGKVDRKYKTASMVGGGCVAGSTCPGGCAIAYVSVSPNQTCGNTVYPQSTCYEHPASSSCSCEKMGVQSGLQACR
jgi:hypothetical protein